MNEDLILKKLLEHDEKFNKIDSRFDELGMKNLEDKDEILTILRRLDEERVFTGSWMDTIEKKVEVHDEDIRKIKEKFAI